MKSQVLFESLKNFFHQGIIRKLFMCIFMFYGLIKVVLNQIKILKLGGHNWGIGEWLINYNGGFVRRGLVGQLVLKLSSSGEVVLTVITLGTILIYSAIWIHMIHFLIDNKFSWIIFLIISSPAGLLFVAWDNNVFIRKEYLGFLLLVVASLLIRFRYLDNLFAIFIAIITMFIFSILASEVNFFLLPGFIFLINQLGISKLRRKYLLSYLIIFSSMSLILIIIFHGSEISSKQICSLVTQSGLQSNLNCLGAISTIDMPLNQAIKLLTHMYPDYLFYAPLLLATIMPFFFIDWFKHNVYWIFFFFLFTSPLYVIAWDYGRWISLFFMESIICLTSVGSISYYYKNSSRLFIVFYALFWGIWHGGSPIQNGLIGGIYSIIKDIRHLLIIS